MLVIIAFFLFMPLTGVAQVANVRDLDMYWKRYDEGSRELLIDSELPGVEVDQEVAFVWNVDLLSRWLYFDNRVTSRTTRDLTTGETDQFRTVSWQAVAGFRLFDHLHLEREHISRHLMDAVGSRRFPARDSWNLRIRFVP